MSSTNNEPEHSELGLNGIHASRPADQPLMTSGVSVIHTDPQSHPVDTF